MDATLKVCRFTQYMKSAWCIATTFKNFHARWCYVNKIAFDGIHKSL